MFLEPGISLVDALPQSGAEETPEKSAHNVPEPFGAGISRENQQTLLVQFIFPDRDMGSTSRGKMCRNTSDKSISH